MTGYDAPGEAVIDRFGGTVVYTVSHTTVYDQGIVVNDGSKKSLYIVPAGGNSRLLAEGGYGPSLSDDGSQILYLARMGGIPQVWVTDRFGFWPRQITRDPAGIQTATLSGDGKVVYATTQGGRLIKVAVATGEVTEAISRTPWFDSSLTAVPGQLSTFTGFGFADSDRTVTIQGKPSRVLGSNATTLWALVPQDVPVSTFGDYFRTLTLNAAPDSPFEGPRTSIGVNAEGAAFLYASPRAFNRMFAAHEDWSGLVSAEAPARPGEVIHAYATGLGATSPAVPFGAAAPAVEPLARSTDPFTCGEYGSSGNVVEVRYQGLAPGLTAVYQMDLLIPRDAAAGTLWIVCRTGQSPVQKSIGGTVPVK